MDDGFTSEVLQRIDSLAQTVGTTSEFLFEAYAERAAACGLIGCVALSLVSMVFLMIFAGGIWFAFTTWRKGDGDWVFGLIVAVVVVVLAIMLAAGAAKSGADYLYPERRAFKNLTADIGRIID
jgi:uncharacterized membrane protein